ncbi:uncharacterized protein LOC143832657 [Paroedura picta]|uniref:uncharacterized protein LOC143832657 n=1 Tax=Paroedura picta TaxID=143630 RepID=UPI001014747A
MDDDYQNEVDSQIDEDYQNKTNCQNEDYKNDIFIQKLLSIPEVSPVPGTARDSEGREMTEQPHEAALDLHCKKGKQISLAWIVLKADKWKDFSRMPIIIFYGLILLSFMMSTAAFVMALLRCFPTCPDGWRYFNEKCYNYSSENNAWNNSRRLCQEEDANLVVINHEEEEDILVYMMSSKDVHWIGFSDLEEKGTWKWVDGTPPTFKNWYTGEPNNSVDEASEYCAVLQKEYNFMWNALPCNNKYKYICEKNMRLACVWQSLCISY